MLRNKKGQEGGGGELLLEIILSSVIFFVVIIFLFSVNIPQQKIKATAHVVSADAALNCELSLTNLLKSNSSQGITYSEWLANSYLKKDFSSWKSEVQLLFNKVLSNGRWDMNVSNGTTVFSIGSINTEEVSQRDIFACSYFVPFYAKQVKDICQWSKTKIGQNQETVEFDGVDAPPDGVVKCEVIDDGQKLGLKIDEFCDLQLDPMSALEEELSNTIEDDHESATDVITLPLRVGMVNYEITIQETSENPPKVFITLARRQSVQDCSLNVMLRTTNVSVAATLAGAS